MSDESRVPASCGFCAICFDSIAPEDETFIDPCFHHFCYKVRNWRLYTFFEIEFLNFGCCRASLNLKG